MSKLATVANTVIVRKNSGANVGTQSRLNLIEGANVTLTVANDPGDNEIDITVASSGGGGGGAAWLKQFYPAVHPNTYKGNYATIAMLDAVDTGVWQTFMIPNDINAITRAVVIIIPNAGGNVRWGISTNYAAVCSNEDYQTHLDSVAAGVSAVTQNEIECLDITTGMSTATGGDLVGMLFTRTASNAVDTIGDTVHYIGVLIEGST